MTTSFSYQPEKRGYVPRPRAVFTIRNWSLRHSRFLEWLYAFFSRMVLMPGYRVLRLTGYKWVDRPVKVIERLTKHFLFDCRMCGDCILSSSGMSCPMNCPKQLRNGPCGGVRANGHCEVVPEMQCVWLEAWQSSQNMKNTNAILTEQPPLDHSLRGTSSWLRIIDRHGNELRQKKMAEENSSLEVVR